MNTSPLRSFLLLALILSSVVGCSKYYLATSPLIDHVLLWRTNGYLDLESEQEEQFKNTWKDVKKNFLPQKITQFQKHLKQLTEQTQANKVDEASLLAAAKEAQEITPDFFNQYLNPISSLLISLDADQIQHLQKKLERENKKLEEKIRLSKEESFEKENDKWIDRLEDWLGPLTSEQEAQLKEQIKKNRAPHEERLTFRKDFQSKMLSILKDSKKKEELSLFLLKYKEVIPSYAPLNEKNSAYTLSWQIYFKNLLNHLTTEQKKFLFKEVSKLQSFLDNMKLI